MRFIISIIISVFLMQPLFAQTLEQQANLKKIAETKNSEWQAKHAEAIRVAEEKGLIIRKEYDNGTVIGLQFFRNGMPMYYMTQNVVAAATISTNQLQPGGSTGLNLTGLGINTIGEWDGGAVRATHQELVGRITQVDGATSQSAHATHVAGTIMASGAYAPAKGMSYEATLNAYDWNNDESEMAAAGGTIRVSNHSYGLVSGWYWNFVGDGRWTWFGDTTVSAEEEYRFGFYDSQAEDWDEIAYNAPNYLIVKSAGNDRNEGPGGEVTHNVWDPGINDWVLSTATRQDDGDVAGYDCINGGGVGKNVLTVGAINDIPGGYTQPSDVVMSSFSCWGPVDDGRIKPDIVANGVGLTSCVSSSDAAYSSYNGTSMSSPNVTGSIGLLLDHLQENFTGRVIRSATMKGLIIHTADEAGTTTGPDYKFGWGLMNTKSAADLLTENGLHASDFNIQELTLDNGETEEFTVYSDGTTPIKVTICWTDKAGTSPAASVDPSDRMLVNDLDLRLTYGGITTYYPWKLDRDNPTNAATNNSDNAVDNVEQVYIAAPNAGVYTVSVTHKGTLSSPAYQNFSLFITGAEELLPPTLTSPANSSMAQPFNLTLAWEAVSNATLYRIQYSTDNTFNSGVTELTTASLSQAIVLAVNNTTYFWRVRAENAYGNGPWSGTWNFTTLLEAPVLSLPADLAVGRMTDGTLTWIASSGADTYTLELSPVSDFSALTANPTGISDVTYDYSGLANNTTYFWRVKAYNASGNSSAYSDDWEFTTIFAPPTLSTPSNNATEVAVAGDLTWNSAAGATTYNLQLSDASDFSNLIIDQTGIAVLTYAFAGLDNDKIYYWRVSGTSAAGTSGWSEVWQFKTILGAPVLASPADNTKGVAVNGTLSWNTVTGATSYGFQLSDVSDFSNLLTDQSGLMDTEYNYSNLDNNTTYYWRANAANADGTSAWSSEWEFKTILATPQLLTPALDSKGVLKTGTLTWAGVSGATTYDVQISEVYNFASYVINLAGVGTNSYNYNLIDGKQYYWRIRAVNADGNSAWSAIWYFQTSLEAPALIAPANMSTGMPFSLSLDWVDVGGATSYHLQVSKTSDFSNLIVNKTGIAATAFVQTGNVLSPYTKYFWRVRAVNANGNGQWSASWYFTTFINNPALKSPLDNSTGQPLSILLEWTNVAGASSYDLQLAESEDFGLMVMEENNLSALSYEYSGLQHFKTYYWRVRAKNANGVTIWSDKWHFTTEVPVPELKSPADGSTDRQLSGTLEWNAVAGAESYVVYVYNNDGAPERIIAQAVESGTSYHYAGLKQTTNYTWKVQAVFPENIRSDWSELWQFTTRQTIQAPILTGPADKSSQQAVNGSLTWQDVSGAESYGIQVSKYEDFNTTVVSDNISATSYNYSGLKKGVKYYWRVNATGNDGTSDWSEVWTFTTIMPAPDPDEEMTDPDSTTAADLSGTLVWNEVDKAIYYELQMSEFEDFSSPVIDETGITDTFYVYSGLDAGKTYYWRVSAVFLDEETNEEISGDWSSGLKFETKMSAPVLLSPADEADGLDPASIDLSWNAVTGAISYNMQLSDVNDFSTTILDNSAISLTTDNASSLDDETTYFWRVQAVNDIGNSDWSEIWSFTTGTHTAVDDLNYTEQFKLNAYPNPFASNTLISFSLPQPASVELRVYNLFGDELAVAAAGNYGDGTHYLNWKAEELGSGTYFLRIFVDGKSESLKLIIVR